jgi:hypothetical protein
MENDARAAAVETFIL